MLRGGSGAIGRRVMSISRETDWRTRLVLCDTRPEVLEAWRLQFEKRPEVEILEGPWPGVGCQALVCPGNAFGFMDGGIALEVLEILGWELQDRLREVVRRGHDGELLLGQAILLDTGREPAWLIYSPVARTALPMTDTVNAYLAARGSLLAIRDHNREHPDTPIESVVLPALCVDEGMHPGISARQMRYAYEQVAGLRGLGDKNLSNLSRREKRLRTIPRSVAESGEES